MPNIKEDRLYTKDHEWAKKNDDGTYTIGITEYAAQVLGDCCMVEFDVDVDDIVESGNAFGTAESSKTLSDLYSPITGRVIAINEELHSEPELINESMWDDGWMIIVEPLAEASHDTVSHEDYRKLLEDE